MYHLYVARTPQRDRLLAYLKEKGVGAGVHYPIPLHRQPVYLRRGYGEVRLPETERAAAEVVSLPLYPELTEGQIDYIVQTVKEYFA